MKRIIVLLLFGIIGISAEAIGTSDVAQHGSQKIGLDTAHEQFPTDRTVWYYHPDHLSSSQYMTNSSGMVSAYYENLPFGETMVEQTNDKLTNNYLFSGKELDRETGLYYFGARYFNPKDGYWMSVDPLAEKYPFRSGYIYCSNTPMNNVDPDGRDDSTATTTIDIGTKTKSMSFNVTETNSKNRYFNNTEVYEYGKLISKSSTELKGNEADKFLSNNWSNFNPSYTQQSFLKTQGARQSTAESNFRDAVLSKNNGDRLNNEDAAAKFILEAAAMIFIPEIAGEWFGTKRGASLVNLTEETFSQAIFRGAENVGGYNVYGTKGLVGNTFNRNIFLIEASGGKSLSGFRSFVKSLEAEALGAGANKISIYGSSVINKGFLNPNIAGRFGYTFEQSGSGVILQKTLKP